MKRSKLLIVAMSVVLLGLVPQVYGAAGRPNNVYRTDAIVVDGNLGEWANTEWAPLDTVYTGAPTIDQASYSIAWSDTKNKLYVAVKIQDQVHVFRNTFNNGSTGHDLVEVYVHMTGTFTSPEGGEVGTNYSSYQASAQEYALFLKPNGTLGTWCSGNNLPWPTVTELTAAGHEGPNGWTYYEAEFVPWIFFGGMMGEPKPASTQLDLASGATVGVDVTMSDTDLDAGAPAYKGFVSENNMTGKYGNYNNIATHTLSGTALTIPSPIPTIDPTPTPTITPTPAPGPLVLVHGNIVLADYDPLDYSVPVAFKLVLFDDSWNIIITDTKVLSGMGGQFTMSPSVAAGNYNLAVKSYGHLAKVVTCAINNTTTTELGDIVLGAGDLHGDNECLFTSLSIVLKYMGSSGDYDPF